VTSDPRVEDLTVTVVRVNTGAGHPWVSVVEADGYCSESVGLRFDLVNKTVECTVESEGDAYPQPPPPWNGVHGTVALSSWDWASSDRVCVEYELHGTRGGRPHCANGKIVFAP
jgi:hypothetical protein